MWFELRADRFTREKSAIGHLLVEDWVKRVEWGVDAQGNAYAEVLFEAGGILRHANLMYPQHYPHVPLRIVPVIEGQKWSHHQWPTGELCLEIRADNWLPDFDGADMLRSARKLLDTEGHLDASGNPGEVAIDHRFTEGQRMLGRYGRLILSDALIEALERRSRDVFALDLHNIEFEKSCVCVAVGLGGGYGFSGWNDPGVPPSFVQMPNHFGLIAQLTRGDARHQALSSGGLTATQRWAAFSGLALTGPCFIVGVLDGRVIAKFLTLDAVVDVYWMRMENEQRLPDRSAHLSEKRVAILGCGSMGSKLAASLARCGVHRFFLVDGDILKTGNLVRHELDWGEVGAHKIDGLEKRLQRINPNVKVEKWLGALDSQVSSLNLQTCLEQLKSCDLLVETTASGHGFNYAAAMAEDGKMPMVWGRVFGGGFGGYIARSRPGFEPPPQRMRHVINQSFEEKGGKMPPQEIDIDYAAGEDGQAPMIADDADVSVITAHLTRFSVDTLAAPASTAYPHSAYLIGLSAGWEFNEPFDTRPLFFPSEAPSAELASES